MANKSKFLKNLLTTASAATLLAVTGVSDVLATGQTVIGKQTANLSSNNFQGSDAKNTPLNANTTIIVAKNNITFTGDNAAIQNVTFSNYGNRFRYVQTHNGTTNLEFVYSVNAATQAIVTASNGGTAIAPGALTDASTDGVRIQNGVANIISDYIFDNTNTEIGDGAKIVITKGKNVQALNNKSIEGIGTNKGTLALEGANKLGANVGATNGLASVQISGGEVDFNPGAAATLKAQSIELKDSAAALKLSQQTNIEGNIVTTGGNNSGTLALNAAAGTQHKLKGNIGADGARIGSVTIANNNQLEITNDAASKTVNFYVNNVTTNAVTNGTILFEQADTVNISSTVGTESSPLAVVQFNQPATAKAMTINLLEGSQIHSKDFALVTATPVDNKLVLKKNTLIGGNVLLNTGNGIISVEGDSTIAGTIGAGGAALKELNFDVEGVTLTLGKNTSFITDINVNKDATLSFNEDADAVLGATKINLVAGDAGVGTVKVNAATGGKTVTVGEIGDAGNNKHLKELQVTGGANVKIDNDVSIKKLNIGTTSDASVILDVNGNKGLKVTISEFAHGNDKGFITVVDSKAPGTGPVTVSKNSKLLGAKDNRIKGIQFDSNDTLALETGVNIYTGDAGINAKTVGKGTIVFNGYHIVDAKIGNSQAINGFDINNAGAAVAFLQDVELKTGATLDANTTAFFNSNLVTQTGIDGVAAGNGNLVFTNTAATEVKSAIGGTTAVEAVFVANGDVTFSNAAFGAGKLAFGFSADKLAGLSATQKDEINKLAAAAGLKFDANSSATATFTDANANNVLGNLEITTTSTKRTHNIISKSAAAIDFTKAVGTADNRFGNIGFTNDVAATISNATFYAGITNETGTADKVSVDIKAVNGKITNLGSSNASLKQVSFTESAEVTDGTWSKDIKVGAAKTATYGGTISSSNGMVLGLGSSTLMRDKAVLDSAITSSKANDGTVTFEGGGAVKKQLGTAASPLSVVNFTAKDPAKVIEMSSHVYSANINASVILAQQADSILSGVTKMTAGGFNAQDHNVTFTNGASTISGDIKTTFKINGSKTGSLQVDGANSSLDMSGISALNISLDNAPLIVDADQRYTIFKAANKATLKSVANNVVTVEQSNRFAGATFNNNDIILSNNRDAAFRDLRANQGARLSDADIEALSAHGITGGTKNTLAIWSDKNAISDKDLADAVTRLVEPEKNESQVAEIAFNGASDQARHRALTDGMPMMSAPSVAVTSSDEGFAAGDNCSDERFGAWFSPFYTNATQKKRSNTAGYEATISGATFGADAKLSQDFVLGGAFTYFNSSAKHKDFKSGDRTKSNGYAFNVYGTYAITDYWFVNGMAHYGMVESKHRAKRIVTSALRQDAKSKADISTFGFEVLGGYHYRMSDVNVTPMWGAAYAHFNNDNYTEKGTTDQNRKIKSKDTNKLEAILGVSVSSDPMLQDGLEITPEAHAFVRHDFLDQKSKFEVTLDGLSKPLTKTGKTNPTRFNVGLGVKVKSDMMEYGIGYDAHLADKYVAHQGTLKVRVNF